MELLNYGMLAILAVLIFFMFRNGQKRKRDMENLRSKVVPGAEVMTNFGLFGTVVSVNSDDNKIDLETAPGVVMTVHSQVVARVVEDTVVADESDTVLNEDNAEFVGEPEFGERLPKDADGTEDSDKK